MYRLIYNRKKSEEKNQEKKNLKWIAARRRYKSLIGYYSRDVSYYAIEYNINFYVRYKWYIDYILSPSTEHFSFHSGSRNSMNEYYAMYLRIIYMDIHFSIYQTVGRLYCKISDRKSKIADRISSYVMTLWVKLPFYGFCLPLFSFKRHR